MCLLNVMDYYILNGYTTLTYLIAIKGIEIDSRIKKMKYYVITKRMNLQMRINRTLLSNKYISMNENKISTLY